MGHSLRDSESGLRSKEVYKYIDIYHTVGTCTISMISYNRKDNSGNIKPFFSSSSVLLQSSHVLPASEPVASQIDRHDQYYVL